MSRFMSVMRDRFIHLYSWLGAIPGTFLVTVLVVYILNPDKYNFSGAVKDLWSNRELMIFLIPWCIVTGYVEAWYVRRRVAKIDGRSKREGDEEAVSTG